LPPDFLRSPTCWYLFFGGLSATTALTPCAMWLARRLGAVDNGGYRRIHQGAIPLLGGLAIALPFIAACLAGCFLRTGMFALLDDSHKQLLVLAGGGTVILLLGVLDDIIGLKARAKFGVQILVALGVCWAGYSMSYFDTPLTGYVGMGKALGWGLTVIWLVGLMNAFNLIDGIDGLATGIALIASLTLTLLGAIRGDTFVVLVGATLVGSLMAFLAYNFHPARVFLGDTGSMFLGFVLATIGLMWNYKSQTTLTFLVPILALGFPIFETLISMLRRFVRGHSMFTGDRFHTHHRLLAKGLSQRQTVLVLYGAAGVCALAGLMAAIPPREDVESKWLLAATRWTPLALYGTAMVGIAWVAGYVRFEHVRLPGISRAVSRRKRNAVLAALSRYVVLGVNSGEGRADLSDVLRLTRKELGLCYLAAWFEEGHLPIGSSGEARKTASNDFDDTERLRLSTSMAQHVIVRFQFVEPPGDIDLLDVSACLAGLFEHARFSPTEGVNVVPVASRRMG
jgi:UDP-GlcNAc:undecaprenyl-phosphate/decaprenyl-phosphate GlcNAc-1-phosphate transferase